MAMSMSMNGYQFERGPMVNCIIFLYKSWVIDSAGKYAGEHDVDCVCNFSAFSLVSKHSSLLFSFVEGDLHT